MIRTSRFPAARDELFAICMRACRLLGAPGMWTMRLKCIACLLALPSCGDDDCCAMDAGPDPTTRQDVASIAVTPNRDIDLLFVIDDSPTVLDKQTSLKNAFPTFVNVLSATPGGFPNVHIGVVTSDL